MLLSPVSCLDNCNGLLYGLPDNAIVKLQRVQKAAARFSTVHLGLAILLRCYTSYTVCQLNIELNVR